MKNIFFNYIKFQIIISLIFILYAFNSFAQTRSNYLESGTKMMSYYSPKEFKGHNQNWAMVQDSSGIMYFANTDGFVLQYDGNSWYKIPVENESIVRSLAIANDGTIFVGAQEDFGYLVPDIKGRLTFQSLKNRIDSTYHQFGDVWKIIVNKHTVYFQMRKFIFSLPVAELKTQNYPITIIKSEKRLHTIYKGKNNQLYVLQIGTGLLEIDKDSLKVIPGGGFYKSDLFAGILPYSTDAKIIATRNRGLFVYNGKRSVQFKTEADDWLKSKQLYSSLLLSDGNFLLCSKKDGAIVMEKDGKVIQIYNSSTVLPNNTVWASFEDKIGNIWLCLNKGIVRIDYASPFCYYNERQGIESSIHDIQRFNSHLYISTGLGLLYLEKSQSGLQPVSFSRVKQINSDCWGINATKDFLLVASINGIYEINKMNEVKLISKYNSWGAQQSTSNRNRFFIGLENGIASIYRNEKGQWIDEGIWPGMNIEARAIAEDKNGNVWTGSSYQGITRIKNVASFLATGGELQVDYYSQKDGLPSNRINFISQIEDDVQFNTVRGILKFDEQKKQFVLNERYSLFNEMKKVEISHVLMSLSPEGNVWLNYGGKLAVKVFNEEPALLITKPFYEIPEYNIQTIFAESENICWFAGSEGLIRYNGNLEESRHLNDKPVIKNIYLKNDSLLFSNIKLQPKISSEIEYAINDIRFEFAAPYYNNYEPVIYQYFLEGFDTHWSQEMTETRKEYTNLKAGDYTFRVRAKNKFGKISKPASFTFTILAPWYRTWWANILFLLILAVFAVYIVRRIIISTRKKAILEQQKIEKTRIKMEEELRSQIAADFHDELGTRITRISLFSEILKKNQKNVIDDSTNYLDKISENADGLYHETRDFIWQLDPNKDRLPDFISRIKNFADELFEESDIQFEIRNRVNNSEKIRLKMEWRRHLVRIFKEAIHNAFKYSGCNIVIFEISQSDDQLIFLLQDDGKGFDLSEKSEGNGLVNMQKRAEKLNAEFLIESKIKSGTKIKLLVKT